MFVDHQTKRIMKKLFFILLSLPLFFSNCQQNNPSPSSSPAPPACCTFSEPSLNYNPSYQVSGQTITVCTGTSVTTNLNGDILNITAMFNSHCIGTFSNDWILTVSLDRQGSNIQSGVTYSVNGIPNGTDPLPICLFLEYNCQNVGTSYVNDSNSSSYNGTTTFNIDWTNLELSGNFSFNLTEQLSTSTRSINNCTFSNLSFNHIEYPI